MNIVFKKSIFVLGILTFVLLGCPEDSLEPWVGSYEFGEYGPPDSGIVWGYGIEIYQVNDNYFATINIDGFQTMTRIKTTVTGNQKKIDFIFEEYLPDNLYELYSKGDLLLSFEINDFKLITHWRKMTPALTENASKGEYFNKP